MAASKVTFTLDRETLQRIADASERLSKPKSQVVREAVADYHSRIGRLSESERQRMLHLFDTLVPLIPARPQTEVDRELREVRDARRSGGRRSMSTPHNKSRKRK
jgi:Ribbon-helix-helix domain